MRYWSAGTEYDAQKHQVEFGAGIELPLEIFLDIRGRYAYVPYDNPTIFPDPSGRNPAGYVLDTRNRREHETGVRVRLEHAFGEHVLCAMSWSRTRSRSTADVYDYTRDLFGVSVRVGLGGCPPILCRHTTRVLARIDGRWLGGERTHRFRVWSLERRLRPSS